MEISFKIQDGDILMYRGDGLVKRWTTLPNDGQLVRALHGVFEEGRRDKAAEIRAALGAR